MAICAVVSVYSVATAPSWEVELGKQILSWSASIVAGQLGVGRGKILGPVGAILGGIAGNLLGGLGAELLSDWFFGGSDATAAELLLGSALEPASKLVEGKISKAGRGYYTHIVRAKHSAAYASGQHAAVQKMVEEIPESSNLQSATCEEGDDEVRTLNCFASKPIESQLTVLNRSWQRLSGFVSGWKCCQPTEGIQKTLSR